MNMRLKCGEFKMDQMYCAYKRDINYRKYKLDHNRWKDHCSLMLTQDCVVLHGRRDFVDVVKFTNYLILKKEIVSNRP